MRTATGPQIDRDVPSAFIQTAQPSAKVRRSRNRAIAIANALIVFIVLATALNAFMAIGNYRNTQMLKQAVASDSSPSFKSRYDILGGQVVQSWLTGDQPVVDTISGLTWPTSSGDHDATGIDVVSVGYLGGKTVSLDGSKNYHESLSYSVVATDGAQYVATIDMGVVKDKDGSVRPVLLSAPFVEPRDSVAVVDGNGAPAWKIVDVKEGSPLEKQVQQWVEAWTTGNGEALKSLSGDSSEATYHGLSSTETWQVADSSTTVQWAVERPSDGRVIVRVTWQMETPEVATDVPSAGGVVTSDPATEGEPLVAQKRIRQSVDLLVSDANTGLPKITAWGAPGTYASLVDYQNATGGK